MTLTRRSGLRAPAHTAIAAALILAVLSDRSASGTPVADDVRPSLVAAVEAGDRDIVRRLLDQGADPDERDHWGRSALHHAANVGDIAIIQSLLDAGATIDILNEQGYTPLVWILEQPDRNADVFRFLLQRGARIDIAVPTLGEGEGRESPLVIAARNEDAEMVRELLLRGADPDGKPGNRRPLGWAMNIRDVRTSVLLLRHGADPDDRLADDSDPVLLAAVRNSPEIAFALLASGADVNVRGHHGRTALHDISAYYSPEPAPALVDLLLLLGADVHARLDVGGATPLHHAAGRDRRALAERLLDAGADVNDVTPDRSITPLHMAAAESFHDVMELLLARGADPDIRGRLLSHPEGVTPLMQCVLNADSAGVNLLLGHGADTRITDDLGRTALDMVELVELDEWVEWPSPEDKQAVVDALRMAKNIHRN